MASYIRLKLFLSIGNLLAKFEEVDNEINVVEVNESGDKIVTGGRDMNLRFFYLNRLYDANKLRKGGTEFTEGCFIPKHSNRVFGLKFLDNEPNILLSTGWDRTLLIWDLRVMNPVNYIYGPAVFGDSLDYKNNKILVGSWRAENQIEIYDFRELKCVKKINIEGEGDNSDNSSFIYACRFDSSGNKVVSGSTGNFEIRIFDLERNGECMANYRNLESGIFSIDLAGEENTFLFSGNNGSCFALNYSQKVN